jgi:hypothetical protein
VWPWLTLVGLGAFHGINPAMGWLFAVALGLHRGRRAAVLEALIPIALGHALAVALVAFAVVSLDLLVHPSVVDVVAGAALVGWAIYQARAGARHGARFGMRTGTIGLGVWSFVMASAHGAGLMLVPVLLPLGRHAAGHGHAGAHLASGSLSVALAAVAVHTAAMLAVTGIVALAVYEWIGLAFLRRSWVNFDRLWIAALFATGLLLLVMAFAGC